MDVKDFYAQSLNIRHPWKVTKVEFQPDVSRVDVRVEATSLTEWVDPDTAERATIHGWRERTWRHLDTCEYETWITAKVPRIKLRDGTIENVQVPWAEPFGRFTTIMERLIIDTILNCKVITSAARQLKITRYQAEGVMERAVNRGLARRKLEPLQLIGIDEKAIRKRHRYATLITDLVSGNVIAVGEGRSKETSLEMIATLPKTSRETIEAVAMDMWPAYIGAVGEALPQAAIVFDKFHIKKHLNEAIDQVRRGEHRELLASGIELLKGTKYDWLRHHTDLRLKAAKELRSLLAESLRTGTAWGLKEMFEHFWSYRYRASAMRFLYGWIDIVKQSGLGPMKKVATMIENHVAGIINYISFPITNASSEGMNSRIQAIKSGARGLPNFRRFRQRVLFFFGGLQLFPA